MNKKGLIVFFAICSLFFAFNAGAQIQGGDIVLQINPEFPKANEEVQATLSSYAIDLNSARITWVLNGETKLEGVGKKNFSFRVTGSDFQTNLETRVETITGSLLSKKITISPSSIDMLWEAYDTYTPPFYRGKTLAPSEGKIKIVAFPSTKNLTGFSYKWQLDGKNNTLSSGYGKNYFVYKNSFLEDKNEVSVTVSDIFGNNIGKGAITVIPGSPKIVFYQKDQGLGTLWEKALTSGFFINPEGTTLVAEPYFFYPKNFGLPGISFNWLINGEKVAVPTIKNQLSIKQASNKPGTAAIKVIINNNNTLFESVEKQLNVGF